MRRCVELLDALESSIKLLGSLAVAVSLDETLVEGERVMGALAGRPIRKLDAPSSCQLLIEFKSMESSSRSPIISE